MDGIACGDIVSAIKTENVLTELRHLGCRAEITLGRLIAADVSLANEERVREFFQAGKRQGHWELQEEESPE